MVVITDVDIPPKRDTTKTFKVTLLITSSVYLTLLSKS